MMWIKLFPFMDHESSVYLSFLSPSSISASSSGSRFPCAFDGGLGRLGSLGVPFVHGNSYSPFTNTSWYLNPLTKISEASDQS